MARIRGDNKPDELKCAFCGKSRETVKNLVRKETWSICICNECISSCNEMLHEEINGPGQWKRLARDLTKAAREGELNLVVGREREIERIIQVLSWREGHSALLVGQPGVGKTSVAHGLAQRIVRSEVPQAFVGKHVYHLDITSITRTVVIRAVQEQWIEQITLEIGDIKQAILFFDDLHATTELAELRWLLVPKGAQVIGAMTSSGYGRIRYPALARAVTLVPVAEPTTTETVKILNSLRDVFQNHYHVTIDVALLSTVAEIASHGMPGKRLPGKAIDLLDEIASLASVRNRSEIDAELVTEALTQGFVKVVGGVQPGESPVRSRNCRAWRGSWAQRRVSAV